MPKGQPVGAEASRQRQRAKIEQVDEVGVGAQPAVEQDRLGLELLDPIDRGRGRQHQHIHLVPDHGRRSRELRQPVLAHEGVHGAEASARLDHGPRGRPECVGACRQKLADGGGALGDPRAGIEQLGRNQERGEVDLDQRSAEADGTLQGLVVDRPRGVVAEELALVGRQHADFEAGEAPTGPLPLLAGERVGRVETGGRLEHQRSVRRGQREDRDAVQRAARRHQAPGRDHALGRLEADDVAERRRHAAGACRVGAKCESHQAGGDRDSGARTGAAWNEGRIEGIAGDAIGCAHADQAGRELVEVGLADQDGAGGDQPVDDGRGPLGRVGEFGAGGRGGQAGHINIVLGREWDAPERATIRLGHGLQCRRPGPQAGRRNPGDPNRVAVTGGKPRQQHLDQPGRRQGARGIAGLESREIEGENVAHARGHLRNGPQAEPLSARPTPARDCMQRSRRRGWHAACQDRSPHLRSQTCPSQRHSSTRTPMSSRPPA